MAAMGDEMTDVGEEITSKKKVSGSELRYFRRLDIYVSSHHTLFSFSIVLYFNEDYVCQKETESCCLCCKADLF